MKVKKGLSLTDLSVMPQTADDRMLEYSMDFVFSVEDKLDELGMSRKQLAERIGCKKSQVTRVLSGEANITLKTIAAYDAALDIGFELKPGNASGEQVARFQVSSGEWGKSKSRGMKPSSVSEVIG